MLTEPRQKETFWTTGSLVDVFPLKYKEMFEPLSIQESVFHLTVFINAVCFPPKETNRETTFSY